MHQMGGRSASAEVRAEGYNGQLTMTGHVGVAKWLLPRSGEAAECSNGRRERGVMVCADGR